MPGRNNGGRRPGGRNLKDRERRGEEIPATQELQRWAQDCPLWKWREKYQLGRNMAATVLGVSPTTIWTWESGGTRPSKGGMAKLVRALGPETVHEWAAWMERKPSWDHWQQWLAKGEATRKGEKGEKGGKGGKEGR